MSELYCPVLVHVRVSLLFPKNKYRCGGTKVKLVNLADASGLAIFAANVDGRVEEAVSAARLAAGGFVQGGLDFFG